MIQEPPRAHASLHGTNTRHLLRPGKRFCTGGVVFMLPPGKTLLLPGRKPQNKFYHPLPPHRQQRKGAFPILRAVFVCVLCVICAFCALSLAKRRGMGYDSNDTAILYAGI